MASRAACSEGSRLAAAGQRTRHRRRRPVSSDRAPGLRAVRWAGRHAIRSVARQIWTSPGAPARTHRDLAVRRRLLCASRPERERSCMCRRGATMADRTLLRVDRDGRVAPLVEARAGYEYPAFVSGRTAPRRDDRRPRAAATSGSSTLERGTRIRFTAGSTSAFPVWAPDGSKMAFQSTAPGPWNLFWKPLDGSAEAQPFLKAADGPLAPSWPNTGADLLAGHAADAVRSRPAVSNVLVARWIHAGLSRAKAERRT